MGRIMAKCSKAQYFCFIIDRNGRICGGGYNGTPSGMLNCVDGGCPRAINNAPSSADYNSGEGLCWAVHAEINALMGVDRETLKGATLYVNGEPCVGCAKQIAGSGGEKSGVLRRKQIRNAHRSTTILHPRNSVRYRPRCRYYHPPRPPLSHKRVGGVMSRWLFYEKPDWILTVFVMNLLGEGSFSFCSTHRYTERQTLLNGEFSMTLPWNWRPMVRKGEG